jgi:hypothetical protein
MLNELATVGPEVEDFDLVAARREQENQRDRRWARLPVVALEAVAAWPG